MVDMVDEMTMEHISDEEWGDDMEPLYKEWLLDISFGVEGIATFVPYLRETDEIVFGLNYGSDKCPGKLVGVIHSDGQAAVEKWCAENPDWHKKYSKEA